MDCIQFAQWLEEHPYWSPLFDVDRDEPVLLGAVYGCTFVPLRDLHKLIQVTKGK